MHITGDKYELIEIHRKIEVVYVLIDGILRNMSIGNWRSVLGSQINVIFTFTYLRAVWDYSSFGGKERSTFTASRSHKSVEENIYSSEMGLRRTH